jgi:LPXTG-motif cell wall-anchored protein
MVPKDYPDPPAGFVNVEIARGNNEYLNSQGWCVMRFLRLVVPAALVILSLSFAPAQAATGDDPGSGGYLGQLFRSLSSSSVDEPPIHTSDETDSPVPVVTQPVDPPPPPKKKFKLTLPVDPPPDTDRAVTPPGDPSPPNPGNLLRVPETPPDIPADEEQAGELAANDDQYDVEENSGATSMSVTSNDSGAITAVQAASMPANGELDQTEMTSFSYTPDPDFVGTDSFTYQAKDANQATSNTATVTINVTPQGSEDPVADPGQGGREGDFTNFDEGEEDDGDEDGDGRRHHKKHGDDDDDDDDGDRRCHRHDHHDHDGDHHGDHGDHGDNEWDEWKKDWNHDWDDDDHHGDKDHFGHHQHDDDDDDDNRCHRDKDDDDGGDLPDTGSPVNLPLLTLSGLLVIAGVGVVRRTRE